MWSCGASKPSQYDVMKYLSHIWILCVSGKYLGQRKYRVDCSVGRLDTGLLAILTISVCTTGQGTQCEWFTCSSVFVIVTAESGAEEQRT